MLTGMGFSLIELRRFDEAIATARKALRQNQAYVPIYYCLTSALGNLRREAELRTVVSRLLELEPDFRVSKWVKRGAQWHKHNKVCDRRRSEGGTFRMTCFEVLLWRESGIGPGQTDVRKWQFFGHARAGLKNVYREAQP